MNRERRYAQDGAVDFNEFSSKGARIFGGYNSSSNTEISIEPGVPYSSSISFDANKQVR
jgi:hypothetical protein